MSDSPLKGQALVGEGHQALAEQLDWGGPQLMSTFRFLSVPAALGVSVLGFGIELPSILIYLLGLVMGGILFLRALKDPELVIACFIIYIPLALLYVVPIAPGLNGTNLFLIMLLISWGAKARRNKEPFFKPMTNTGLVRLWAILSFGSVITACFTSGVDYIFPDRLLLLKAWLDQFLVFYMMINLIRDGAMARRVVVYMMIGAALVLALSFQEWLEKREVGNMEKARLLGPQGQPNDLGAFLVYTVGPYLGVLLVYAWRWRAWLVAVYLAAVMRVLLGTFSRGAFIGFGLASVVATFLRSRLLLLTVIGAAALVVTTAPEYLPGSLTARVNQTGGGGTGQELDRSAATRLILWDAAIAIALDSPLVGKGFATFPRFKGQYTAEEVSESDNHNMYLYIVSQMGIPALVVFVTILLSLLWYSARVAWTMTDPFGRAVGIGGAATAAGALGVNMFGSRMTDIVVMGYIWIYLAVISHLWQEQLNNKKASAARQVSKPLGVAP